VQIFSSLLISPKTLSITDRAAARVVVEMNRFPPHRASA
jgi:hypothetical protein